MGLIHVDLRTIVEAAATLEERLRADQVLPAESADNAAARARVSTWIERVAEGDEARFARCLDWDGVDAESFRRALGPARLRWESDLPSWAYCLEAVLNASALLSTDTDGESGDRTFGETPRPFQDVLLPFVRVGRERLRASEADALLPVAPAGLAHLEQGLLRRLSEVAEQTLFYEFNVFRASGGGDDHPAGVYAAFVRDVQRDGLRRLMLRYPVLARLLAGTIERWVESTRELLRHLAQDRGPLSATFNDGRDLGRAVGFETELSDPHRGGRAVAIVTFECGLQLVYKPKDLGMEADFYRLLGWLNERGAWPALKVLGVLECEGHGWVEFVRFADCAGEEALVRYYERAGALLCLGYLLGGSDLHAENLIAAGEHPVLIDLEVLMGAPAQPSPDRKHMESPALEEGLWHSVLRTALLPLPIADPLVGGLADEGGFLSRPRGEVIRRSGWRHVNTDLMSWGTNERIHSGGTNVPRVDGRPRAAADHVEDIVRGFRRMHTLLERWREAMLADVGQLPSFRKRRSRMILRHTRTYLALLRHSLRPDVLRDGADRSVQLSVLKSRQLLATERPPLWPVMHEEQRALEQLDIPIFHVEGGTLALVGEPHVPDFLVRSGYDCVTRRLDTLDDQDREAQASLIRIGFAAAAGRQATARTRVPDAKERKEGLSGERARSEAVAIAQAIDAVGLEGGGGERTWWMVADPAPPRLPVFRECDPSLWQGTSGIALFFAALARITGDEKWADKALEVLRPIAALAAAGGAASLADRLGIGAGAGVGGLMYVLARVGRWLDHPFLLTGARALAHSITTTRLAADDKLDVLGGAAGATLGLLAVRDATGDEGCLRLARRCGDHLRQTRSTHAPSGLRSWRTLGGELTTGFAHGSAGIGYALVRLYEASGEGAYLDAAREAIALESQLFVPEANNWQESAADRGEDWTPDELWCTWCHGAAGIGLARAASAETLGRAAVRADIEAAAAATLGARVHGLDHLCCGTLGRAELLASAGRALERPDLERAAAHLAARVVARRHTNGSYGTGGNDALSPTFFQGLAGIGYQLLRLHHPRELPSVLVWA